jgi:hypothetical protein
VGNNTKNSSLKQTPSNMDSRETIQKNSSLKQTPSNMDSREIIQKIAL